MINKIRQKRNTRNLDKEIARDVYVKSLQELVKKIEDQKNEIEYYKNKNKTQRIAIQRLKSRLRELEGKKKNERKSYRDNIQ